MLCGSIQSTIHSTVMAEFYSIYDYSQCFWHKIHSTFVVFYIGTLVFSSNKINPFAKYALFIDEYYYCPVISISDGMNMVRSNYIYSIINKTQFCDLAYLHTCIAACMCILIIISQNGVFLLSMECTHGAQIHLL